MTERTLPVPTPETRFFWDGAREGELRIQRCGACGKAYFPPRPHCPECGARDVRVERASGRAKLLSYVINHLGAPGMEPPFAVAIVELEEGPRMMSNILGCPQTPEALVLDMPLEVTFEKLTDEITLPQFKPAEAAR